MSELDPNPEDEWESLIEIGSYPSLNKAYEHALVALAMNIPCWISDKNGDDHYTLYIEPDYGERIRAELEAYEAEQPSIRIAAAPEHDAFQYGPGWPLYFLWAITLMAIHLIQSENPAIIENGASFNIAIIDNYQWWRPFTALFLHADVPHLIGNLLSGMLFGTVLARSIGAVRAWLMILVSGTLANFITAIVTWPVAYSSIGASGAVFGALGLLSGIGFAGMVRHRLKLPWARTAAPVIGGLILLAWLGSGAPGDNTDVFGHLFGFLSGLMLGAIMGYLKTDESDGGVTSRSNQKSKTKGPQR